jgi:glycosyltransferase involved in cell wall biosynthesis
MRNLKTEQEIMQHWKGDPSQPLVSISCITYNHEPYIEDALEGFLIQKTDFPFEVLVHDDASTDKTAEIVWEYAARYPNIIKPIYQTENQYSQGIKISINYQYPRAKGKYIAICEGDDYWIDPEKLHIQVEFLEENQDYGMVHSDSDVLYNKTGLTILSKNKANKQNIKYETCSNPFWGILTGDYMVRTCTVLARKELFINSPDDEIIFNPDNKQGDLPRWLSISNITKIKYLPKSTTVYRITIGSASKPVLKLNKIIFQESSKRIRLEYAQKYQVPPFVMKKVEDMYYNVMVTKGYHLQNKQIVNEAFKRIHKKKWHHLIKYYSINFAFLWYIVDYIRIFRLKIYSVKAQMTKKQI